MNDYKGLIELLAHPADGRDNADIMISAADAIEHLVKERDAAVAEIHWLIVSWFTTGRINACEICCNYNDGNHNNECKNCHTLCPYSNFSWRGVQDE